MGHILLEMGGGADMSLWENQYIWTQHGKINVYLAVKYSLEKSETAILYKLNNIKSIGS